MITLHRLGHTLEAFQLNSEMIMFVEANPDTVITLTNGHKVVVAETPERIAEQVRAQRIEVLAGAMSLRGSLRAAGQALRSRPALRSDRTGVAEVTALPFSSTEHTGRS